VDLLLSWELLLLCASVLLESDLLIASVLPDLLHGPLLPEGLDIFAHLFLFQS